MSKKISFLLLGITLMLLLTACDSVSAYSNTAQSTIPLAGDEIIIDEISINEAKEIFGEYIKCETACESGRAKVKLSFDGAQLFIEYAEGRISFMEMKGFDYGEKKFELTDLDKNKEGKITRILWADKAIGGPRGIEIGDSEKEVRSKFLDKSEKYGDKVIYTIADMDTNDIDSKCYKKCGALVTKNTSSIEQICDADYALEYYIPNPIDDFYEASIFYIKNGKLVGIEQRINHI